MATRIERVNIITEFDARGSERYQKQVDKSRDSVGGFSAIARKAIPIIAGVFSGIALKNFVVDAVAAQAEFEKTAKSIEIFVGSAARATELVQELEDFSIVTPFTPEEVVGATKTMLAFGVAQEKVVDITRQLGEVSAASGAPLQNLAFVFGQVQAQGKAMTQDLNQFINAGVPIFELLAESMKVPASEMRKLAAEGKITAEVIAQAFEQATDVGGRFAGSLEAQSKTILGLQSTLQGAQQAFLRAFGERIEGRIKSVLTGAINMVNAFRDFVKIPVEQKLEEERVEFGLLVRQLQDTNIEQEERNRIIADLQSKYGAYIGNIDLEKASQAELNRVIREGNQQFLARIALVTQQERVKKLETKLTKEATDVADIERRAIIKLNEALGLLTDQQGQSIEGQRGTAAQLKQANAVILSATRDLAQEQQRLRDSATGPTAGTPLGEEIDELGSQIIRLNKLRVDIVSLQGPILRRAKADLDPLQSQLDQELDILKKFQAELDRLLPQLTEGEEEVVTPDGIDPKELRKQLNERLKALDDALKLEQTMLEAQFEDNIITQREFNSRDADLRIEHLQAQLREIERFGFASSAEFKQTAADLQLFLAQLEAPAIGSLEDLRDRLKEINAEISRSDPETTAFESLNAEALALEEQIERVQTRIAILRGEGPPISEDPGEPPPVAFPVELGGEEELFRSLEELDARIQLTAVQKVREAREALAQASLQPDADREKNFKAFQDRLTQIEIEGIDDRIKALRRMIAVEEDEGNMIEAFQLRAELLDAVVQKEQAFVDSTEESQKAFQEMLSAGLEVLDSGQEVVDSLLESLDRAIETQRRRVQETQDIAERGNAELLQIEEDRLRELEERRRRAAQTQRALAFIEFAANSAVAISKAAAEGGIFAPLTIAAVIAAIAAGIGRIQGLFGEFYRGTEYVQGPAGRDKVPAMLTRGERVVDEKSNRQMAGISNDDLVEAVRQFNMNRTVTVVPQVDVTDGFPTGRVPVGLRTDTFRIIPISKEGALSDESKVLREVKEEVAGVKHAIREMAFYLDVDMNGIRSGVRRGDRYNMDTDFIMRN